MKDKKERILFKLTIYNVNTDQETEYTIIDENSSFSTLSVQERQNFLKTHQLKIKKLISREYRPDFQEPI